MTTAWVAPFCTFKSNSILLFRCLFQPIQLWTFWHTSDDPCTLFRRWKKAETCLHKNNILVVAWLTDKSRQPQHNGDREFDNLFKWLNIIILAHFVLQQKVSDEKKSNGMSLLAKVARYKRLFRIEGKIAFLSAVECKNWPFCSKYTNNINSVTNC